LGTGTRAWFCVVVALTAAVAVFADVLVVIILPKWRPVICSSGRNLQGIQM
jgi:hypothetical protein